MEKARNRGPAAPRNASLAARLCPRAASWRSGGQEPVDVSNGGTPSYLQCWEPGQHFKLPAKGAFRGEILLGDLSAAQAYAPNRQRALTNAVLAGGGLRPSAPPSY